MSSLIRACECVPMRSIVLIGDSLTQQGYTSGWVSTLSSYFVRVADVINRGLSGYTSRWVLDALQHNDTTHYIPSHLCAPTPSTSVMLAVIFLGANDAMVPGTGPQYVPIDEFKDNMKSIIQWVQQHITPTHGVLLITPPPVDSEAWAHEAFTKYGVAVDVRNRSTANTRKYRDVVLSLASSGDGETSTMSKSCPSRVAVVDSFAAVMTNKVDILNNDDESNDELTRDWKSMFYDGLHFNEKGGELLGHTVMSAISDQLHITVQQEPLGPVPCHRTLTPFQSV